ncbi:MAG: trehalose-6-phosphate synthase, partial [candidate division Zixibacteria bacterium]|nr:trehalose-6-phosphate synthase [candidate division Zixibacteria bacterium]
MSKIVEIHDRMKSAAEAGMRNRPQAEFEKLVKDKLGVSKFVLVSNREPYVHFYSGDKIEYYRYASGMSIALDSIAQVTQGIWVAHGSGDADFKVTDSHNRIMVPPDNPVYTLKRIRLNKSQENGYYYGFSNRVLWPLCHVVFVRPKFESHFWDAYQKVNRYFAEAV